MPQKNPLLILTTCCLLLGPQFLCADTGYQKAMDFETEGVWLSAPDLLNEFKEEDLCSTHILPFAKLSGGVKLSDKYVKSGKFSAKWTNHPFYPTIHTTQVPKDWSIAKCLTFWIYSERRTDEAITLAVESDSPKTLWKDYFMFSFKVEWAGWKKFRIPFSDFDRYEEPAGWHKVDAIYFFTKIFNRQPNPYTVLYIDGMKLESEEAPSIRKVNRGQELGGRLPHRGEVPEFDPSILNHRYPETRSEGLVNAPIQYEPYFKAERAIYGYYPRFQPGFVSFSPSGHPYIQYGSYIIETLGDDGKWTYRDLLAEVIEPYARERLKFKGLGISNSGQNNDATIRFDKDGDAYILCFIWDTTKDWRSRRGLLLHSRDGLKTWTVYMLPYYMARFEKFVGHNHDRLNRPPVILLSRYYYGAPVTIFVTIPEKQSDGTLVIPKPQKIADDAIPFVPHSGEANNAVTHGDKVYIVYGQLKVLPGHTVKDGAPSYAVTYDIRTKKLSKPVLIGFGGIDAKDAHNWPALAVDSKGILHVIINGHHNPFIYIHSKKPYSITEWTAPESVAEGTSYGGLICDKSDTLYTITRNSHPGYYFRLSLHRKKVGQQWESPKHLVVPFKSYYKIWFHKLVMDPATERLFLSYYSQSPTVCFFKDEYLAYLYIWPDREKILLGGKGGARIPLGTDRNRTQPRKYEIYFGLPASEMTTLVSNDGGDSWHLATTKDFEL